MNRQRIVMVTTSYPRFPGDTVGTFMEPIAQGVASRGHEVHVVAPWHPKLARAPREGNVTFHFFRYAPLRRLNVFGYAAALRADVDLRWAAYAVAPLALAAGWATARRVARQVSATILHGHWVIPGGAIAAAAAGSTPLVISLHGSDVYVAERHALARVAARFVFARCGWVTACSDDLAGRALALGAPRDRVDIVPYGVDTDRFRPDEAAHARGRALLGVSAEAPLVFTAGRMVSKKGFEYLIDAAALVAARRPDLEVAIAGGGDLEPALRARAAARGLGGRIRFPGVLAQDAIADCLSAADIAVVPSVRDDGGNVDGLPNVVMEALASGTPLVATTAGGIGRVVTCGETGLLVPERDPKALARAIEDLLDDPTARQRLGRAARAEVMRAHGWTRVIDSLEVIYDRLAPR